MGQVSNTREWLVVAVEHEKLAWVEYQDLVNRLRSEGNEEAAKKVIEIMNDESDHRAILNRLLHGEEATAVEKVRRGAKIDGKVEIETEATVRISKESAKAIDELTKEACELRDLAKSLKESITAARARKPDLESPRVGVV